MKRNFIKTILAIITISFCLSWGTPIYAKEKYGFDTYSIEEQQETEDTYVLNTKSMKIHVPSCKSVKKIKPSNYSTSSKTIDELKEDGYTVCKQCHATETKKK